MRVAAVAFIVIAIACEAFAWWGLSTVSGRATFDEMAGIIPFAAGVAGGVFIAVAAAIAWLARRRR